MLSTSNISCTSLHCSFTSSHEKVFSLLFNPENAKPFNDCFPNKNFQIFRDYSRLIVEFFQIVCFSLLIIPKVRNETIKKET